MGKDIILKGSSVQQVDKKCISDGIDSKWLMKNAGESVSGKIIQDFAAVINDKKLKGIIVCGSGNNGGDGFVAAIDLLKKGVFVEVFSTSPVDKFSPDSIFYYEELKKLKSSKIEFLDIKTKTNLQIQINFNKPYTAKKYK